MEQAMSDKERKFWDRYRKLLPDQHVKPQSARWYVWRAQQFIAAFPGRRLGSLSPEDVTDYLTQAGSNPTIKAWQLPQLVHAMRILYSTVRADWTAGFDWEVTPEQFGERVGKLALRR